MREGLLAEFDDPSRLLVSLRALRAEGHADLDAYSPHPVEGVADALGFPRSTVSTFTLCGGVAGALTAYLGQWWISAVDYPLNVGGRPLHSAPAFIPITFELTVLFAALSTVAALFLKARLGSLWAPVDEINAFESVSVDRFWLAVGVEPGEPSTSVEQSLLEHGALRVVAFGRAP